MYNESNKKKKKQWARNRSQCLWENCKKSAEGKGIYIQKSEIKTDSKAQTEENEVKVS